MLTGLITKPIARFRHFDLLTVIEHKYKYFTCRYKNIRIFAENIYNI
jgi:hypothetical protein